MGHQVNFFLTPRDTDILTGDLQKVGPFLVLHSRASTSAPRILESLNLVESGKPWLYFFLVHPDDLDAVVMRNVPAQGYWTVDVVESPVIEFSRCFFDDKTLRRGRMYYVDRFYASDGELQQKSVSFQKWARLIFTTTRKSLKKLDADYVGQDAVAWLAASGGLHFE
jgi:hypothetical protein